MGEEREDLFWRTVSFCVWQIIPKKLFTDAAARPGLGAGVDYQTWGNLDQVIGTFYQIGLILHSLLQNVFAGDAQQQPSSAPTPAPSAAPAADFDAGESSNKQEGGIREGMGQGAEYGTWNNLNQDVFADNA